MLPRPFAIREKPLAEETGERQSIPSTLMSSAMSSRRMPWPSPVISKLFRWPGELRAGEQVNGWIQKCCPLLPRYPLLASCFRLLNYSIPQSFNPPIPQSFNPSIPQSLNSSIPQSLNSSIPQSFNPSIPQSLNPSIPQSSIPQFLNPSIPQSLNSSIPQSLNPSIPQSLNPSIPKFLNS